MNDTTRRYPPKLGALPERLPALPARVAAVTIMAVLAVGCGVRHQGGAAAGTASQHGVVPWVSRHAPVLHVRPVTTTAHSALYQSCVSGNLSARAGMPTPGAGRLLLDVTVTNTGTSPCTLTGHPSGVGGTNAAGDAVTFSTGLAGPGIYGPGPANLTPGGSAEVFLSTMLECSSSTAASQITSVQLDVGGGALTAALPSGQALGTACGVGVSDFGPPQQQATPSSPLDVLNATTTMPARIKARGTVRYLVTLTNPTSQVVSLRACPSYIEFLAALGANPLATRHIYYLNCEAARSIPAHSSVTYAMRIPAPAKIGPAKYGWFLQGTSVQAGGALTIAS